MAWIEVHQSLPTHPKTIEAAMLLDVTEAEVVGHIICLWLWALDARADGRLDISKPRILARAAQWDKEPGRFVDALVAVGFVDSDGAIHDWDDYTGRLMERRERVNEQTKARMRSYRERKRLSFIEGMVTHDVTRNELRSYASVTHLPNPTQPNPTIYTTTDVVVGAPDKPDAPPTPLALPIQAVPKPVKAKAPSHPAVAAYRRLTGISPREAIRSLIADAVPDADEPALGVWCRVVGEWMARGYQLRNVDGMLEWYRDGIPPKHRGRAPPPPAAATPRPSLNVNVNGPYQQPQSLQRQPLPANLPDVGAGVTRLSMADFEQFKRGRQRKPASTKGAPKGDT